MTWLTPAARGCDLDDPETYRRYFQKLYQAVELDAHKIQSARTRLDFPAVAQAFRMIPDDSASVCWSSDFLYLGWVDASIAVSTRCGCRVEKWRGRLGDAYRLGHAHRPAQTSSTRRCRHTQHLGELGNPLPGRL